MNLKKRFIFLGALLLFFSARAWSAEEGKFSGLAFGDYFYVANQHDTTKEGVKGFQLRRIYFTYDRKLQPNAKMRLRFEMNDPGDFKSSSKRAPFLKDAYISWTARLASWTVGLSPTPTFDNVESFFGYRAVEKTPLDLQKMGSSRDFGVKVKGTFQNHVDYQLMFGNGKGEKSQNEKGGKVMGLIGFHLTKKLYAEVYGDFASSASTRTAQVFLAYKAKRGRVGLQLARQVRNTGGNTLSSLFGVFPVNPKTDVLLRVDRLFDKNPNGEKIAYTPMAATAEPTIVIAGVAYRVQPKVQLIPNVEWIAYSHATNGSNPKSDLYGKLTLYVTF